MELEIRQDLISDAAGQAAWAQRLARLLPPLAWSPSAPRAESTSTATAAAMVATTPAAVTLLALGRALGRARVRGASLPRQLALDAPERRPLLSWAPASPTVVVPCVAAPLHPAAVAWARG